MQSLSEELADGWLRERLPLSTLLASGAGMPPDAHMNKVFSSIADGLYLGSVYGVDDLCAQCNVRLVVRVNAGKGEPPFRIVATRPFKSEALTYRPPVSGATSTDRTAAASSSSVLIVDEATFYARLRDSLQQPPPQFDHEWQFTPVFVRSIVALDSPGFDLYPWFDETSCLIEAVLRARAATIAAGPPASRLAQFTAEAAASSQQQQPTKEPTTTTTTHVKFPRNFTAPSGTNRFRSTFGPPPGANLWAPCVAVHCMAGVSRSAAIVAAYLLRRTTAASVRVTPPPPPPSSSSSSSQPTLIGDDSTAAVAPPTSASASVADAKAMAERAVRDVVSQMKAKRSVVEPNSGFVRQLERWHVTRFLSLLRPAEFATGLLRHHHRRDTRLLLCVAFALAMESPGQGIDVCAMIESVGQLLWRRPQAATAVAAATFGGDDDPQRAPRADDSPSPDAPSLLVDALAAVLADERDDELMSSLSRVRFADGVIRHAVYGIVYSPAIISEGSEPDSQVRRALRLWRLDASQPLASRFAGSVSSPRLNHHDDDDGGDGDESMIPSMAKCVARSFCASFAFLPFVVMADVAAWVAVAAFLGSGGPEQPSHAVGVRLVERVARRVVFPLDPGTAQPGGDAPLAVTPQFLSEIVAAEESGAAVDGVARPADPEIDCFVYLARRCGGLCASSSVGGGSEALTSALHQWLAAAPRVWFDCGDEADGDGVADDDDSSNATRIRQIRSSLLAEKAAGAVFALAVVASPALRRPHDQQIMSDRIGGSGNTATGGDVAASPHIECDDSASSAGGSADVAEPQHHQHAAMVMGTLFGALSSPSVTANRATDPSMARHLSDWCARMSVKFDVATAGLR